MLQGAHELGSNRLGVHVGLADLLGVDVDGEDRGSNLIPDNREVVAEIHDTLQDGTGISNSSPAVSSIRGITGIQHARIPLSLSSLGEELSHGLCEHYGRLDRNQRLLVNIGEVHADIADLLIVAGGMDRPGGAGTEGLEEAALHVLIKIHNLPAVLQGIAGGLVLSAVPEDGVALTLHAAIHDAVSDHGEVIPDILTESQGGHGPVPVLLQALLEHRDGWGGRGNEHEIAPGDALGHGGVHGGEHGVTGDHLCIHIVLGKDECDLLIGGIEAKDGLKVLQLLKGEEGKNGVELSDGDHFTERKGFRKEGRERKGFRKERKGRNGLEERQPSLTRRQSLQFFPRSFPETF